MSGSLANSGSRAAAAVSLRRRRSFEGVFTAVQAT